MRNNDATEMVLNTSEGDWEQRFLRMQASFQTARAELEERLRFEEFLAEISARFINLPADLIDDEIESAQRRICEFLDVDRSALWQTPDIEAGTLILTHIYQSQGCPPIPKHPYSRDLFPWTAQKLLAGEMVAIEKISDLPPEAGRDRENYSRYATKSTLLWPLSVGGGPTFGALSFAVTRQERDWPETVVKGLRLIAQVFANALARKRTDESLRESETRLSLATSAAGVGLWILEAETGHVWVTPKTRELLCFEPDKDVRYENFFEVIHQKDREQVRQAVQHALQSGEGLKCDYRIVLPDGNTRWIAARGQRYLRSTEEPARMMGVLLDITERKGMENQLKERFQEIEALKLRLEKENIYLQEEVRLLVEHTEIVGQSAAMKNVLNQAEQVARTDSTVLLLGETGTGKELLARAIHKMSLRKGRPLVTINCAALPPTLIESELFGREKGAYTGAMTRMTGRFEIADGSTLFLDEIGELPLDLQSKLLRVIEEGKFERLGSSKSVHVNIRIIAATNRHLVHDVRDGKFRQDLFYRLNVFPIELPPLRERPEDIPLLVWTFVEDFQKRMGKEIVCIPKKTMQALQSYSWPGNIRELRNVIEHAMIVSSTSTLAVSVPWSESSATQETSDLKHIERTHLLDVLNKTNWRIAGKGGAAEILGLKRTTLQSLMKRLNITRPHE